MRKFTKFFTSTLCLLLLITASVFAQIPASQQVVIVEPGTATLETAINSDVDANGNRINPTRVYQLKKDGIYIMSSPILFGSVTSKDTTSTLIIVGETGGKKPVVIMSPKDGGNAFRNDVHGSLTIKNVYWPAQALNNTGSVLFQLYRSNQRLILEDFITESCTNGDKFVLSSVKGTMDIYFKNCYFRDNTQFANPWNFATFARGDNAQAIDTLWIENTTVGNAGLTFFGKGTPINFTFFDHNTIINVAKYVFFFEQYKEAYFTNNIFINCNWQGEDYNMGKTQLESQATSGAGNPPVYVGVLNLMEMNANAWTLGHGSVPKMEDVKWMASNNVHFTSPFLNKYQTGGYGDGKSYPVSYLDWGVLPAGTTFPLEVKNVPPMFMSAKTQELVDKYPGIVAETNHIQVDPKMVTLGIANQAEADLYAQWARNNFAIKGVTLPDDATFSFGDQDPKTIPGIESENGGGFKTITDLVEDFSYTAAISSKIDARHLGSLQWYPGELTAYDSKAALANIKSYYNKQVTASNQKVIIVEPGTGTLETAINSDVDANGNRNDPTRVYQLKKDGIYIMSSPILFGSVTSKDTTSTLIIVGETGGKKPVVIMSPKDGGNAFRNDVHGSLTIKNVYWPAQAVNNTGSVLFQLYRSNQRLILEDFVTESCTNGDKFVLSSVRGTMDIYFKNCYFRDNTQFANPWNFATFARGDNAQAIDTLWIENTTVGNAGLTFFGKGTPINFTFFNHNTIINVAKYVFFFEQYKEAYFTNNIFINCNWQGEDFNMGKTQLESQATSGAGNPPVYVGVLNLMEMNANAWTLGHGSVPKMEDVKWIASNNLHFTSPFLNKYQTGGYGDGKPYPVSYLDWGVLPAGTTFPLEVKNIPPMFMSAKTQELVDKYPGIVAETNHIQVDPKMVTLGIANQAEGDLYAQWARNNFAIKGVTLPDDATFSFGDQDPKTIPGIETENGGGFKTVNDLLEDFSYTEAISSKIDARHLGSLQWYPSELATYNSKDALSSIKSYYQGVTTSINVNKAGLTSKVYPNPTQGVLNIDNPATGSFGYEIIAITGKLVLSKNNITEKTTKVDMSGLTKGIYIVNVISGEKSIKHKVIFQ